MGCAWSPRACKFSLADLQGKQRSVRSCLLETHFASNTNLSLPINVWKRRPFYPSVRKKECALSRQRTQSGWPQDKRKKSRWEKGSNTNQKCRKTAHDQSATCLYRKERTSQLIPGRGVIILHALRKQSGREFGTDKDTLQYLKRITNKDLLYGTGNFLEQPKREKNLKKNRHMYVHN